MKKPVAKARALLGEANRLALRLTVLALGFYAVVVLVISASNSTLFDGSLAAVLVFALPLVGLAPATLLHELGHAVAAWLCGWRVWIICVGPVVVRLSPHVSVHARASFGGDAGGFVLPSPRNIEHATRLRSVAITAGGPLASVVGAAASFAIAEPFLYSAGWPGLLLGVLYAFGISSLACAVLTLWPHRNRAGAGNDIVKVIDTLSRKRDRRSVFFHHALGVVEYGFCPTEWDEPVRAEANRGDSPRSSLALATAFLDALARDDLDDARALAGAPLPTDKSPSTHFYLRAWLEACERGDFAQADNALAACRGSDAQSSWLMHVRELALIGILAADGETSLARQKCYSLRERIRPPTPANKIIARLVDRAIAGPVGAALNAAVKAA